MTVPDWLTVQRFGELEHRRNSDQNMGRSMGGRSRLIGLVIGKIQCTNTQNDSAWL